MGMIYYGEYWFMGSSIRIDVYWSWAGTMNKLSCFSDEAALDENLDNLQFWNKEHYLIEQDL